MRQSESEASVVPNWANQGAQRPERSSSWAEVSDWNARLLAALVTTSKEAPPPWLDLVSPRQSTAIL